MRLVILGGGGFRVPVVHGRLLDDPQRLVAELVLHDVDRSRLEAIRAVLDQQARDRPWRPRLCVTTDLDQALDGADVVFSAVRVGGLQGRALDERIALRHGLLGQETVGVGGISFALRTVPVVLTVARRLAAVAPAAWLINFTNPAGVVTEAMSAVLGDRVVGICDSPVALFRRVAAALGVGMDRAWFDYVGLNHLGWLRRVLVAGRDELPRLLDDPEALAGVEEGRLFGASWLRTLGAIPNEYLHYYYFAREVREQVLAQEITRGEFLRDQQDRFYEQVRGATDRALQLWTEVRQERERTYFAEGRAVAGSGKRATEDLTGGGYEEVALRLLRAVVTGHRDTLVLNVRNRGVVAGLDPDAVVEVPCQVDGNGPRPVALGPVEPHFLGLMQQVKAADRATIAAAVHRSRRDALLAMAAHPLVDSVRAAERVLDDYVAALPGLADLA
ncbi:6-phospho-beta-glucosidase [Longimycelium tulufanense]|uniref:6-phospho-beta-glucosidase n=1 Tax=Longimycelium tulufanense TaxID=907463 RepID=A0A8J3CH24_9PSEU|nr:6-phospho-beta-glucosidase [Longimycelium tulufanense]GGM60042.1 6-phospho-beta-glucosidase [Longimycelium tulufanense]